MKKFLCGFLILLMLVGMSACGKKQTFAVTFDSLGGTNIESQSVEKGKCAIKPSNPEKDGFTFVEWQCDSKTYNFDTPIESDILLTAYYEIKQGTEIVLVMLDYQNGQEMGIVEIIKGGTMTEPPVPQRQGYKFVGWFVDNTKYNFSAVLNENITLTAKWEINKTSTTQNKKPNNDSSKSNTNTNNTTNDNDGQREDNKNYDLIVEKYVGRWYLNGYSDVCIDVSIKHQYYDAMSIISHNFSFDAYVSYPHRTDVSGWGSGFDIAYESWDKSLKEQKVILGKDCIYINNNKFTKTPGEIDRYYGTCYKEALGTWYLENYPNSFIEILTSWEGNIDNSDSFNIRASNFSFKDFSTNSSTSSAGSGKADRKDDWDKLGISVENDTLTITNKNGVRKFYKTKTYQKVIGIALDSTNVELSIGKTKSLKAAISPSNVYNQELTWSSDNSSVATVSSSGVITAIGEGSTKIIVKTKDGNYSATCKVTVSVIHANSVSLNKTSLEMTIGNTYQLSAEITPSNSENKNVSWSSSNESIVQVSSTGNITAKSKGSAVITVKTLDGGYIATCEVVVKEPKLMVSASIGVTYYSSGSVLGRGVFCEVKPSGGSGNYIAYSIKLYYNGTLVEEVSKNKVIVTPFKNGTYTAEVYVKDSSGNEATATKTTTISY